LTATYLINRLLFQVLKGITLVQLMITFYPFILILTSLQSDVFGCPAFVHSSYRGKLDPRAIKCVFIGYASNKRGTNIITLKVVKSMFPRMSPFIKQNPSFLVLTFRGIVFKKLRSLSCHIFLCGMISFLRRMTKTLNQHHYQRRIRTIKINIHYINRNI